MSIRDLMEQFKIEGEVHIKVLDEYNYIYETLCFLNDFRYDWYEIDEDILERKITYMYAVDGLLNIEVE